MILPNPLGTRPPDDLAEAMDAVISEIDRQHAIHSIDVEHTRMNMSCPPLAHLSRALTDQEAVAANKIVDGQDDHDANGIDDEAPEEASWMSVK